MPLKVEWFFSDFVKFESQWQNPLTGKRDIRRSPVSTKNNILNHDYNIFLLNIFTTCITSRADYKYTQSSFANEDI